MLSHEDLRKSTIQDWQNEFYEIYGERNQKRGPCELWLSVVRHVSRVAEEIRKGKLDSALHEISYTLCWYFNFVNFCQHTDKNTTVLHFDDSLNKIIWFKYPRCCPVCLKDRCICLSYKQNIELLSHSEREKLSLDNANTLAIKRNADLPESLIAWKNMFGYVYGEANITLSINEICFHLLEEIGEVAQELFLINNLSNKQNSESRINPLQEEIADVFSWTMALLINIQSHFSMMHRFENSMKEEISTHNQNVDYDEHKEFDIPDILWKSYANCSGIEQHCVCHHCGGRPCHCGDEELILEQKNINYRKLFTSFR